MFNIFKGKVLSNDIDEKKFKKMKDCVGVDLIDNEYQKVTLYKVGGVVYMPTVSYHDDKIEYYPISRLTFILDEESALTKNPTYYVSAEYKKNGNTYFYSFEDCDEKHKQNVQNVIQDVVKIGVREKGKKDVEIKPLNLEK